ncbi:MAG: GrpB family protein [Chloroflexota bacterium]|nr:GrpB family protein [Chloroflexota bacterium]
MSQSVISDEKPLGESLGWHRLGTERPFRSHWHNLRQDQVRLPAGQKITFTYQEHPGFITVVPLTSDGQVVMIRSYRYTVDDWCWEMPAGGLGDNAGLPPEEVARQELLQEAGATCVEMCNIGWFYSMNGTADARCTIFLAVGVALNGDQQLEATEQIEVQLVPVEKALQMARDGRMTDGDSALALLRCEPHLIRRTRSTRVVPHDPRWPLRFAEEAARLAQVFGQELVAIHHMGSTAIPGIVAKPIIDILPEVKEIEKVDLLNDEMIALGYVPKGELGIPGRCYFSKDLEGERRYHVHVFQTGNPEIARHLDLVEYLKTHPGEASRYAELKQQLAKQYPHDVHRYTDGKSDLITELAERARLWKETLAS